MGYTMCIVLSTFYSSLICTFIYMQTMFDEPSGHGPVGLNMGSMGKGEVWVNGQSIGRYWVSFLTPSGHPSQSM